VEPVPKGTCSRWFNLTAPVDAPQSMTAKEVTDALQAHLRAAGLPRSYTMHSFRVGNSLTQLLEGSTVEDAVLQTAGWRTESVA